MTSSEKFTELARQIAENGQAQIILLAPIYYGDTLLFIDGVEITATAWNPDDETVGLSWVDDGELEVEEQWVWLTPDFWSVASDAAIQPLKARIQVVPGETVGRVVPID